MNEWIDRQTDRQTGGQRQETILENYVGGKNRSMDGWIDWQTEQTDGWAVGWTETDRREITSLFADVGLSVRPYSIN